MEGWSHLCFDILRSIQEAMPYSAKQKIGAVCSAWHQACCTDAWRPRCRVPWIFFIPRTNSMESELRNTCRVISLFDNKFYRVCLPLEVWGYELVGTCMSWLLMVDEKNNLIAIDPFSNALLHLPPLQSKRSKCCKVRIHIALTTTHECSIAVAICGSEQNSIAFARPGDMSWKYVDTPPLEGYDTFNDILVYNDKFYIVSSVGKLLTLDFCRGSSSLTPPRLEVFFDLEVSPIWSDVAGVENCLVESPTGELWLVLMKEDNIRFSTSVYVIPRIAIYRFDGREVRPRWVEVEMMGDQLVMLFGESCVLFSARDLPHMFKGNCIYYLDKYSRLVGDESFLKVYEFPGGVMSDLVIDSFTQDSYSSFLGSHQSMLIVPKVF